MPHVGLHFAGTSCLCECHFVKGRQCTDHSCRMTGRSEAKATQVVPVVTQVPVVAQAGQPMVGFSTPFGPTTRFGS